MLNVKEYLEKYGETHVRHGNQDFYLVNSDEPHGLNNTCEGYILDEHGRVQEYAFGPMLAEPEFTDEQEYDDSDEGVAFRMAEYERLSGDRTWFAETLDKYYPWPYYPDRCPVAVRLVKDIATPSGVVRAGQMFHCVIRSRFYVSNSEEDNTYFTLQAVYDMPQYFQPIYGTQ
jgi:hypothetical protein